MFDQSNSYQGGVILPETAVMEPAVKAMQDHGETMPATSESGGIPALPDVADVLNTPDAFLHKAKVEATLLLEETRAEAAGMRDRILADARAEAEEIKAAALTEIANRFGNDLWSSRYALSDIVSEALAHMIGEMGEEEATVMAVEHAIRRYCSDREIEVRAEKSTADRLRLALLSKRSDLPVTLLKIRNDDLLAKGRCIISDGEKTFEASIRGQLQTINNLGTDIVAATSDTDQEE